MELFGPEIPAGPGLVCIVKGVSLQAQDDAVGPCSASCWPPVTRGDPRGPSGSLQASSPGAGAQGAAAQRGDTELRGQDTPRGTWAPSGAAQGNSGKFNTAQVLPLGPSRLGKVWRCCG